MVAGMFIRSFAAAQDTCAAGAHSLASSLRSRAPSGSRLLSFPLRLRGTAERVDERVGRRPQPLADDVARLLSVDVEPEADPLARRLVRENPHPLLRLDADPLRGG